MKQLETLFLINALYVQIVGPSRPELVQYLQLLVPVQRCWRCTRVLVLVLRAPHCLQLLASSRSECIFIKSIPNRRISRVAIRDCPAASESAMGVCSSAREDAPVELAAHAPAPVSVEQNVIADLAKGEALLKEAYSPDEAAEVDTNAAPAPADESTAAASGEALLKQALG